MNTSFHDRLTAGIVNWMENKPTPDGVIRAGIRRLCAARLQQLDAGDGEAQMHALQAFIERMNTGPIAPVPQKANEQHYELPPEFFALCLGPHRKYSSCYWSAQAQLLEQAERESLLQTCAHAELADGQDILELGCGWGSLSLWMAGRYPRARITAVSNSAPQRQYILQQAQQRGLTNLSVLTADMNQLQRPAAGYDRVVSVEMFEHMRNYRALLERIAHWLRPEGKLMIHVFCHARHAYAFDTDGARNWMGRHFFTGGIMPSDDLLLRCNEHLGVRRQWRWSGTHYQRTANAWLANLDANRGAALELLGRTYGAAEARRWLQRWRIFFMACAELFGYQGGRQWGVAHYLLEPQPSRLISAAPESPSWHVEAAALPASAD